MKNRRCCCLKFVGSLLTICLYCIPFAQAADPMATHQRRSRHVQDVASDDSVPQGMALIPAGTFTMGDSKSNGYQAPQQEGSANERPKHDVYVSAFYMDIDEVTMGSTEWTRRVNWAGGNGYDIGQDALYGKPWFKCVKWCNARSELEGLTPCYRNADGTVYKKGDFSGDCNWTVDGYRLPTEAEWEKAARGGLKGMRFPWGDTSDYRIDYVCIQGADPQMYPYLTPPGNSVLNVNKYGLRNMVGNGGEWCWDGYSATYYQKSPANDPRGPLPGASAGHVLRGGRWVGNTVCFCRVSNRNNGIPTGGGNVYVGYGFRCCRPKLNDDDDPSPKVHRQTANTGLHPRLPKRGNPTIDDPRAETSPMVVSTSLVENSLAVAPPEESSTPILSLNGLWKDTAGTEFSMEDDGNLVAVTMVKTTGTISKFSGSLSWHDGELDSPYLAGSVEVVFRTNPGTTNNMKAVMNGNSPRSIRLRWNRDVPAGHASDLCAGTFILNKQQ